MTTPLEILSLIQDLTGEQLDRIKHFILSKLCIVPVVAKADTTKHLPNYLHWKIWLLKAVRLVQSMRGANRFQEAIQHTFAITKEQVYAKNPISVVA